MALKVIGAGFFRTGTLSLKRALEELGYARCWHGLEIMAKPEIIDVFTAAAAGDSADYATMFDADVRSVVDFAGLLFYKELFEASPGAKVILTVRDEDKWYASVYNALYKYARREGSFPMLGERAAPAKRLIWTHIFHNRFEDKQYVLGLYRAHIEHVQRVIPKEKLLVYRVEEGWEPLCQFLGVPVPTTPFPVTNSSQEMATNLETAHSIDKETTSK